MLARLAAWAGCRNDGRLRSCGRRARSCGSQVTPTSTTLAPPPNASRSSGPMPDESTTPDLVELVRSSAESAPHDLDAFLGFLADDAVWEACLPDDGGQAADPYARRVTD